MKSNEAFSGRLWRSSGTRAGLSYSSPQEIENIIPYYWRDLFRTDRASYRDSLLVGIEEVNTVWADPQMLLEIPPDVPTQFIVQVIEHEVRHLLAGLVSQYFPSCLSCRHVERPHAAECPNRTANLPRRNKRAR